MERRHSTQTQRSVNRNRERIIYIHCLPDVLMYIISKWKSKALTCYLSFSLALSLSLSLPPSFTCLLCPTAEQQSVYSDGRTQCSLNINYNNIFNNLVSSFVSAPAMTAHGCGDQCELDFVQHAHDGVGQVHLRAGKGERRQPGGHHRHERLG